MQISSGLHFAIIVLLTATTLPVSAATAPVTTPVAVTPVARAHVAPTPAASAPVTVTPVAAPAVVAAPVAATPAPAPAAPATPIDSATAAAEKGINDDADSFSTHGKSITQRLQFDWGKPGHYAANATISGMTADKKNCGPSCLLYTLTAAPSFTGGNIHFEFIDAACKAILDIPFIIQYDYLVTRFDTYKLKWLAANNQSCTTKVLNLVVDGDPTEASGYTFTLTETKPKE